MKRTLIYNCVNKEYSHWIPLYCGALLENNKNIDIEIRMEGTLDVGESVAVDFLKERFPDSKIMIIENGLKTKTNGHAIIDGKETIINTARFITTPLIKDDYVYIGDIDIICLEENIADIHVKHMEENNMVYDNIVRSGTKRMSGLHFSKYNSYYPLPDLNGINLLKNDEEVLRDIVARKIGEDNINYKTQFRSQHGIHASKQRPEVGGTGKIIGWGAGQWKEPWKRFRESETYKMIYPCLNSYIKSQILKLEKFYEN